MKKAISLVIIIAALLVIRNLASSIYNLWQKQDLLTQAQKELAIEKKRHESLKKEFSQVQSQEYIEALARNRLFLVRENEQPIVIPPALLRASDAGTLTVVDARPNWQKWADLFF